MRLYRCVAPSWLLEQSPNLAPTVEGELDEKTIRHLNDTGYNIYYLPNRPSVYEGGSVKGFQIDKFNYVFIDMDLKDNKYASKDEFIDTLLAFPLKATLIVDSGNGVHVYWKIADLDAKSYLKLSRRLMRYFKTDESVGQIYQLLRCPNTINTKDPHNYKSCVAVGEDKNLIYTCDQLNAALPPISFADEQYCLQHFSKTYGDKETITEVDDKIPLRFAELVNENQEAAEIWRGGIEDRSKGDFRLGHIMFASGFTKDEAMSVLVNSAKALGRSPKHRVGYAENIVNKIWLYEAKDSNLMLELSSSVRDILSRPVDTQKNTRFPCWKYFDNTVYGFRLGHVVGLVAGSGVGKTATALNMFEGFVTNNPEYVHFFIPLEQPAYEIADRWRLMCGDQVDKYDKVHIMDNYAPDGTFRHLSFNEIKDYIIKFQEVTKKKVGCVVIDHIGALRKQGAKAGENQDLMNICHSMKAFAQQTNTMLVMQSQAPREKAGVGDLELNKDAAFGTVFFESYCDYLITLWQPLKRCYAEGAPTITAFKFCKIRHKKQGIDNIKEDVCYQMLFDPSTERLRELTQKEEQAVKFWLNKASNKRKGDRKTEIIEYVSARS